MAGAVHTAVFPVIAGIDWFESLKQKFLLYAQPLSTNYR